MECQRPHRTVTLAVNGAAEYAAGRTADASGGCAAGAIEPDRHASGMRAGCVRRLHCADRRHPATSCIAYAVDCEGSRITTIEGFDADPVMAELREAFSVHHALQCGFCTAGMLMTARDIVLRLGEVPEARIREELAGNLCRCTGYMGIVSAVRAVAAGRAPQAGRRLPCPAAVVVQRSESVAAELCRQRPASSPRPACLVEQCWRSGCAWRLHPKRGPCCPICAASLRACRVRNWRRWKATA